MNDFPPKPANQKFAIRVDGRNLAPVFNSVDEAEQAASASLGTRVEIVDRLTGRVVKLVTAQLG
jgi:hypothetical protein